MSGVISWASAAVERVNPIVVEFRQAVQSRLVVVILDDLPAGQPGGRRRLPADVAGGGHQRDRRAGRSSRDWWACCCLHAACSCPCMCWCAFRWSGTTRTSTCFSSRPFRRWAPPPRKVRGGHGPDAADLQRLHALYRLHLSPARRQPDDDRLVAGRWASWSARGFNAVGVFAGCIPASWTLRVLALLSRSDGRRWAPSPFDGGDRGSMSTIGGRRGTSGPTGGWSFRAVAGTWLLLELLAIGLLQVFSVAMLSPKPANRMLAPHLYLTAAVGDYRRAERLLDRAHWATSARSMFGGPPVAGCSSG